MLVVCERWVGTDCYILNQSSSDHSNTSFSFWLGSSTVGHWGPKPSVCWHLLSNGLQQQLELELTNWLKPSMAPGYIIVWHPPASCGCTHLHRIQPRPQVKVIYRYLRLDVPVLLIYTDAYIDWRLGWGSICYNHHILIFQNSTCVIFLHVRLHPPHTHILQIMPKDNNSKKYKRNTWTTVEIQKEIRRLPSHYVTLAQANFYLNLFYTNLCAVGYLDMRTSQYNTDTSFILTNTIMPSAIPWRISEP